jgi:hypothetical protein
MKRYLYPNANCACAYALVTKSLSRSEKEDCLVDIIKTYIAGY